MGVKKLEEFFLCILLVSMIALACLQIVLRDFFSGGFLWADPLLRYMVLWSGMFGAAVATREGKHIALDVVSFLVPPHLKPWLQIVIHLFSSLVSMALTYAAFLFVRNEMEFGGIVLLSIPSWGWNLVFPLAFALISLRFLAAASGEILTVASPPESQPVNELPL
jgi:TRAP-type C4-dicarboxylate transport system permease small subunit